MTKDQTMGDCIVVGGGLLGMLTARALVQAGVAVCLLERGTVCRESSWAGGGIISPLVPWEYPDTVSELVSWSQQYYPRLADELREETGIDVERVVSGMMLIGLEADARVHEWADKYPCGLESLDESQVQAMEPALSKGLGGGLLLPDVAQVRNPRLGRGLYQSLLHLGVEVHENTEVTGILTHAGSVRGVATSRGDLKAGRVVIAGGAWSSQLLVTTGLDLPVTPVRGQMILFRTLPGLLRHIVLYRDHYLIPRMDGHILAGSTLEHAGFDKSVTAAARAQLARRALWLMPSLSDYGIVRQWAGLRPGSPDGTPFIGDHPEIRGLYLNTGHFRNGVVMGPASARLLADRILGRESFTDYQAYLSERIIKK